MYITDRKLSCCWGEYMYVHMYVTIKTLVIHVSLLRKKKKKKTGTKKGSVWANYLSIIGLSVDIK